MLRRKMLTFLAGLVVLLVVVSAAAIWMLQDVLGALDRSNTQDAAIVDTTNRMGTEINEIEIELRAIQIGRSRHLDDLISHIEALKEDTSAFGQDYEQPLPEAKALYERITANLAVFEREVGMLSTLPDEGLARTHMESALQASMTLRQDIWTVGRMMREHTALLQRGAIGWFRWVVLGLAVVFLLVINISVMMMVRMGQMVLRPVERLVEASRRLGREEFDYRVQLRADDEFGELAAAYNRLAEQLQANERRKLETLAQAAVALNHELNNAGAIIKLQLQLLERQSTGSPAFARALVQIHESLARMTVTLERLKHLRRIVLTDYTEGAEGMKMLDLERSAAEN
jgi:methyl-accepting chemotaxis protein